MYTYYVLNVDSKSWACLMFSTTPRTSLLCLCPRSVHVIIANVWASYKLFSWKAVGFGNVWRFPAKAYQFGGGAWFIPYLLALFLIGIPILFLEIGLGQYYQRGDISVFSGIHKRMRGVGMISVICGYMLLTYYVMLLTWVLRTIFESGSKSAPWQDENASVDSSESYFFTTIVGMDGREYPERLIWPNVGYCALTYLIIFLCTAFGKFSFYFMIYFVLVGYTTYHQYAMFLNSSNLTMFILVALPFQVSK